MIERRDLETEITCFESVFLGALNPYFKSVHILGLYNWEEWKQGLQGQQCVLMLLELVLDNLII